MSSQAIVTPEQTKNYGTRAAGKVMYHPCGLLFTGRISIQEHHAIGVTLLTTLRAVNWWIGDWILQSEQRWGEKYVQFVETVGFDYQTIANTAWVCRALPFSLRRETLSWSHHKEIAVLEREQQKQALEWACQPHRHPLTDEPRDRRSVDELSVFKKALQIGRDPLEALADFWLEERQRKQIEAVKAAAKAAALTGGHNMTDAYAEYELNRQQKADASAAVDVTPPHTEVTFETAVREIVVAPADLTAAQIDKWGLTNIPLDAELVLSVRIHRHD